jgi:hypothetical protein
MTRPTFPDPDLAELLRLCLAGLMPPMPGLSHVLDRFEVRR